MVNVDILVKRLIGLPFWKVMLGEQIVFDDLKYILDD